MFFVPVHSVYVCQQIPKHPSCFSLSVLLSTGRFSGSPQVSRLTMTHPVASWSPMSPFRDRTCRAAFRPRGRLGSDQSINGARGTCPDFKHTPLFSRHNGEATYTEPAQLPRASITKQTNVLRATHVLALLVGFGVPMPQDFQPNPNTFDGIAFC